MRLLFVTAEMAPLVKTGGLADVSASLPEALRQRGIDVRVLLPAYPQLLKRANAIREVLRFGDPFGWGEARLLEALPPEGDTPLWLIDCPRLYNRDGGPYQDGDGRDWADNHLRFALLAHVAAAIAGEQGARWYPDIVHAHDWHAGLVPTLIKSRASTVPPVVFTIHNLGYQGLFSAQRFADLNVQQGAFADLEYFGQISFLKAGIQGADVVSTVSPTYAEEILSTEHGCGLDGVLRNRASAPVGIFNGIDCEAWNPARDPYLAASYSSSAMGGKSDCKAAFQMEMGLAQSASTPLLAFSSRLCHQKMPDVVLEALPPLLDRGVQFALVAEGEAQYEAAFRDLAKRYPGQASAQIGYEEPLAHRLLAAADILLHPARYEPCGLVPLYAMRYATVPVVRRCGGLADSVVDSLDEAPKGAPATGFFFEEPTAAAMLAAASRALTAYEQPLVWRRLLAAGMWKDFSWGSAADKYVDLYKALRPEADTGTFGLAGGERTAEKREAAL